MGRFVQADTVVPDGMQGMDRYAYVNNSPLNYVDPSGHFGKCHDGQSGYQCRMTLLRAAIVNFQGTIAKEKLEEKRDSRRGRAGLGGFFTSIYEFSPEQARQLIEDLDTISNAMAILDITTTIGGFVAGVKAVIDVAKGNPDMSLPLLVAITFGITLSEAVQVIAAFAIAITLYVTLPTSLTLINLSSLRNALSDTNAADNGAIIIDKYRGIYHQITITSETRNGACGPATTFIVPFVFPAMSYLPQYLWLWTKVHNVHEAEDE